MKKNLFAGVLVFCFASHVVHAQTSVTAGPEQKVKTEMNVPSAVRPGGEFTVEIKITKGDISGLGRFQQFLPSGMTATAVENDGADFSFENHYVKLIWLALPQQEMLTIKYKVSVDGSVSTTKTLSGTFSYVENGRTKTHAIVPKEIKIDANAPVAEESAQAEENKTETPKADAEPSNVETTIETITLPVEEIKTETPTAAESKSESETIVAHQTVVIPEQKTKEKKSVNATDAEKNISEKKVAKTNEPPVPTPPSGTTSAGIIFKVQIAAMNEKHFRKDGYFQSKFGITQTVYTEEHEGLKKYCIGNFSAYSEARKLRDEIIANANGSFIVAYKDGIRISVPEAMQAVKVK